MSNPFDKRSVTEMGHAPFCRARVCRRLVLLALLAAAPVLLLAQGPPEGRGQRPVAPPRDFRQPPDQAPRGTAIIRGVVLAADTGTPIRRAQVRAVANGIRENRLATTDAQGRFEFKELAAGRYTLSASKGGFVGLQYGQRRPSESGTPLEIGESQVLDKLVIALPRGSVISGRIFDEFGEPVANAVVNAMRYGYSQGSQRYLPAPGQNSRDTTDDQGQFRLFGLPPGDYIVSANFRAGGEVTDSIAEPSGYAPTYFPGTVNISEAQRVRVDISQEQTSVNFALVATRLVRLSGTVLDSQGAPVTAGAVMLMPAEGAQGPAGMLAGGERLDRTGAFRINNVAPGRYVLQVRSFPGGGRGGRGLVFADGAGELGRLDLAVGQEDVNGLVLVTRPGATVSGVITTDTSQPPSFTPDRLQISTIASPPATAMPGGAARVNPDWTFSLANLFDARLFRVSAPQGWALKQVLLNGQDITDTPTEFAAAQTVSGVQVVLTDKVTNVSGSITDARGNPVTDAAVVVFPADDRLWTFQSRFIRTTRPDQDGRYEIRGLPAYDDYLLAAVQGLEDGQASDPEFLARTKRNAADLALKEGETKVLNVALK